ncbi:MAG: heme transporter [Bilophila sp.]
MDTTTVSLLFGSLGVGLFWWGAKRLARRCSGKASPSAPETLPAQESSPDGDAPWEKTSRIYRKILYLRLAGFALCLLAAGSLFLKAGTFVAVVLASVGLYMQYLAYHARTQHVFAVKKAVESQFLATLQKPQSQNCNDQ